MKFNLDMKNKKVAVEADVEKLVEKGMEQQKDWKDKFNTKHSASKEMLEMKHKQKMEIEEKNQEKKNWIQKIQEERRKTKELELEYERKREEEQMKVTKIKIVISSILGIIGITMMCVGFLLGSKSGNPDSGWYAIACVGFFPLLGAPFCWIGSSEQKEKKKKHN